MKTGRKKRGTRIKFSWVCGVMKHNYYIVEAVNKRFEKERSEG